MRKKAQRGERFFKQPLASSATPRRRRSFNRRWLPLLLLLHPLRAVAKLPKLLLTRPSPAARRREDAAWRSIVVLVFLGLKVEKGNLLAPFFFFLEARRKNELRPSTRFCFFAFVFFKRRKTPRGGLPPGSSSGDRHAGELLSREIPLSDENHEKRKVERYKE